MSGTVFISHSTKELAAVQFVSRLVSAQGLHDPHPGRHLPDKIRSNIFLQMAVIVLLTHSGIDSRYVHQEIGVAQAARKLIVPLVHPDLVDEDLAMLNGSEFLVFDPESAANATPDLVDQLRKIANKAAVRDAVHELLVAALVVGVIYVAMKDGGGGAVT